MFRSVVDQAYEDFLSPDHAKAVPDNINAQQAHANLQKVVKALQGLAVIDSIGELDPAFEIPQKSLKEFADLALISEEELIADYPNFKYGEALWKRKEQVILDFYQALSGCLDTESDQEDDYSDYYDAVYLTLLDLARCYPKNEIEDEDYILISTGVQYNRETLEEELERQIAEGNTRLMDPAGTPFRLRDEIYLREALRLAPINKDINSRVIVTNGWKRAGEWADRILQNIYSWEVGGDKYKTSEGSGRVGGFKIGSYIQKFNNAIPILSFFVGIARLFATPVMWGMEYSQANSQVRKIEQHERLAQSELRAQLGSQSERTENASRSQSVALEYQEDQRERSESEFSLPFELQEEPMEDECYDENDDILLDLDSNGFIGNRREGVGEWYESKSGPTAGYFVRAKSIDQVTPNQRFSLNLQTEDNIARLSTASQAEQTHADEHKDSSTAASPANSYVASTGFFGATVRAQQLQTRRDHYLRPSTFGEDDFPQLRTPGLSQSSSG